MGLASRDGIVPLALSQDTGGPIARSVIDAAAALDAVVGIDDGDPVTARQAGHVPADVCGVPRRRFARGQPDRLHDLDVRIEPRHARAVGADQTAPRAEGRDSRRAHRPRRLEHDPRPGRSGSGPEFNHDLQAYIDSYLDPDVSARSLLQISQSDNIVPGRANNPYGQRATVTPDAYEAWAGPNGTHTVQLATGKVIVTQLMDDFDLDGIVYPSGNPYSTIGSNMRLSPNTGLPAVTVPMGWVAASGNSPAGNVNLEWLGRDFSEGPLLGLAYSFEQATHARTAPELYGPLP